MFNPDHHGVIKWQQCLLPLIFLTPPLLFVLSIILSFCNMESIPNKDETEKKLHIAMFPWLAFGHMIPFLQFSKLLAQKGHKISFISTPRNIHRLPKLPPNLSHLITFVKLPLPQVPDLPQDFESTADVLTEQLPLLENAYDLLQRPFADVLRASRPDWVLFDFSPYWVPDVARSLDIPSAFFSIFMASCVAYVSPPSGEEDRRRTLEDFTKPPGWIPFPSTNAFRNFEAKIWLPSEVLDETRVSAFYRFRETIKRCDIIAVRTCVELEQEWLQLLAGIHRKPVIPVGVLSPNSWSATEEDEAWEPIKKWLDKQKKGSVVYIAFGTEAKPSPEDLNEIALGLELSRLPFFWVLKLQNELPDGFLERTREKGVVFSNWAPQLKILAHESVGGFLTHSGWSSVVEAVQFEKPMVLLPMGNDQGLNAKLFQEKKMGFMMQRDEYDGSFTREAVAESLKTVIVKEEEGKIYRDRVKEMKGLLGLENGDKQNMYLDNFLTRLRTHNL